MLASPVLDLQKQAGATVSQAFGWSLSSSYSSLAQEYEATRRGVGLVDRSHIGRLRLTGEDALNLLNRLSTNDLELITSVGQGVCTVLTSNKGRILDLLFVHRLEDGLLVLTSPQNRQKVADWIDFYTIVEDVAIRDVTEDTAMLAVVGPRASSLLSEITGHDISSLSRYDSLAAKVSDIEMSVVRTDFASLPGYDMIVPASRAEPLWQHLLDKGAEVGIVPVGMEALEAVRIEEGVPLYGRELSEEVNPLEANLLEWISFNKGCYIGQEVVARLDTYKKVQRHLVGLSWDVDEDPAANAGLFLQGKRVGDITSTVRPPGRSEGIGLGYVRKAHAQAGVRLAVETADGELVAQVEDLPFKPS